MEKHENQNEGLSLQESGGNQCEAGQADARKWMKSEKKDEYVDLMTGCFQKVGADWEQSDSRRFVNAVERLMFDNIDTPILFRQQVEEEGMTFHFNVVENTFSNELLDTLMEYHPGKWKFIQDAFLDDGVVDLVYEDRYLCSPLGCLMLAQFIRRLKGMFTLTFRSIRIVLSKTDFRVVFDDDTLKVNRKFSHLENRDRFLRQCMDEIVSVPYDLEVGDVKHSRSLTVSNSRFVFTILFDGGIIHGWIIDKEAYSNLTIDVLQKQLDTNIPCYNQAAHTHDRKGIPYVVSFIPKHREVN